MAKFYDAFMKKMEESCLASWRSNLLTEVQGDILEIGSGTGINLIHYPRSFAKLIMTEPDPYMLELLKKNIEKQANEKVTAEQQPADNLNFPDNTFDAVVSTLVLCSVDSPDEVLHEIKRILKPGGKLFFIEHVVAVNRPKLIKWQKIFQPFWIFMCGNCHLTRDTEKYISNAGFTFDQIDRVNSLGGPSIVSPTIKGTARSV